jgi:hypothetical protein
MAQGPYYGRNRAYGSFTADVEDFVKETNERMEAVMRASLNDVVENAQTPVAKGGRMRVHTGFLLYDGFLEAALQHWGRIVAFHTEALRGRIK